MSELPDGWVRAPIHALTADVASIDPGSKPTCEFRYIDISAIDNRTFSIVPESIKTFKGSDAPSRARRPVASGDVLYSNVRTYLKNVAVVPSPAVADVCSTGFTVLRSTFAVVPTYLFRYLLTDEFLEVIAPHETGTHYPATSDRAVRSQLIPLPPLAEQRRMVEKVEALLAPVNAARDRLAAIPGLLKRFRQSILTAACSGRLTEDWRVDERGPALLDATEDHEIPVGWNRSRVADVATVCLGGTPSRKESSYWGGRIPWVSSGEVANCRISTTRESITRAGFNSSNAKLYPRGTVLIAMIGEGKTRGQSAILDVEACTNQNVAGLVFHPDAVDSEYVWRWAQSQYERNRSEGRGGNYPALNGAKVRALCLPVPPIAEQREIARRVEALFALGEAIEARVAAATARAEKLTQSILAKAFRGDLVPTEAELARREGRDYEPASVLLERIRAERASAREPRAQLRSKAKERA